MTKRKTTKRALLSSCIALMLCFSMLLGTTFAWFTDEVTSAGNIIQSGTLDAQMYYGDSANNITNDASTGTIFNYEYWEPGYTQIKYIKIKNAGNLAFRYKLHVIPSEQTTGAFNLADVIDVYMLPANADVSREAIAAATPVGTLADLMVDPDGAAYGVMLPENGATNVQINAGDESLVAVDAAGNPANEIDYCVVLKMQESAGNDYQNLSVNGSFAVQLLATQYTWEKDSFDNNYDAPATYPIVSVPVQRPEAAEDVTLMGDASETPVIITLPAEMVEEIPAEVETLSLVYTEPKIDAANNVVTFDAIDIVDQDGEIVELADLNLNQFLTIKLPVGDAFAEGEAVTVYHDGVAVATTTVAADKTITYEVAHLCEVVVAGSEDLTANEDGIYEIGTTAELLAFANAVNTGKSYKGEQIVLVDNIDLAGMKWTPIGNWNNAFEGNFDGQGYTISNLYINITDENDGSGVGLFGVAQNATIEGINVHNVDITGYEMVAAIVGSPYTGCTVSDCHVTGDISIVAEWAYAGGICAYGYLDIENCSVIADEKGEITAEDRNAVGGITAWMLEGDNHITNCQVENLDLTGWTNIGGLTGFIHYSNVIEGCSVENVNITKTREDGYPGVGMAAGGFSYNANNASTIKDNSFTNITLNGTAVAISNADILHGSEYGGSSNSNFVMDNNVQENIENNLIYVNEIKTVADLSTALATGGKYVLKANLATSETITVPNGVDVTLYMNGKTIAGTFSGTGNQDMFLVKGDLTVKNGTITMDATVNQGWNAMSAIFDITAGGVVNLDNVVAENEGGTDMNFVVHMNNWGEVTLNAENCELKAAYMPVRVFNSGFDMNNVFIQNSTLEGGNHSFWVHNYIGDLDASKHSDDAVEARLNFEIFDNGNTFITGKDYPVRYGFANSIYFDADGIQQ